MTKLSDFITNNFFIWTIITAPLALLYPPLFTWFRGGMITIGLGFIMLGMGLTLTIEDFERILKMPAAVFTGVGLQYIVMPSLGWLAGYLFRLPAPYAVGLILVASCPGGTASNVISFLARANVALSVTMTAVSTSLAVFLTPVLTGLLAGNRLHVDIIGLIISTVKVVVVPISLGVLLNRYIPKITKKIQLVSPSAAVILIILIVGSILGANRDTFLRQKSVGLQLIGAVFFVHTFGFLLGYLAGKLFVKDENSSRTISIEVGMQNSGLGTVLAKNNFTNPMVVVPSALSAVTHCILGSIAAVIWRKYLTLTEKEP